MLKFLTHKLRTHSLNEESVSEKVEERDSGTESDDEAERADTGEFGTDVIMKWNDVTDISMGGEACACAPAPPAARRPAREPEPDQLYDHHSSEEELEVINKAGGAGESRRRGASSPPGAPERKWLRPDLRPAPAPSDDDDDTKVETPVRFRTSPPLEALKPRRALPVCACAEGGRGRRRALLESRGRRARRGALRVLLVMTCSPSAPVAAQRPPAVTPRARGRDPPAGPGRDPPAGHPRPHWPRLLGRCAPSEPERSPTSPW